MAKKRNAKEKVTQIVVKAKVVKAAGSQSGKIVVKGKGIYKTIPAVLFTESETETLLEIIDKVEKDTNDNIVYSS